MSKRKKEISKELGDKLRSVSFAPPGEIPDVPDIPNLVDVPDTPTVHIKDDTTINQEKVPHKTTKPFSLNKRVVTLEYLDKFEQATKASAQYEAIKEFSHTISNMSIILLSASIIVYLAFYFINPDSITMVSLLILFLEALTLLGLTLYTMAKASTSKQIQDILISDFSTCSQAIGNPRADAYVPMDMPNTATK